MTAHDNDAVLTAVTAVVWEDPGRGVQRLREVLRGGVLDLAFRADLLILLAEALQRQGSLAEARKAQHAALRTITELQPSDRRRLIMAVGAGADLAVCDRRLDAVPVCTEYLTEVVHDPSPDAQQVMLAGALRAVAIYHASSCKDGRRLLRILHQRVPADSVMGAVLAAGVTAMEAGCQQGCAALVRDLLPPWPGAVLSPSGEPEAACLARRIALHPAVHTCALALTHEGAASAGKTS